MRPRSRCAAAGVPAAALACVLIALAASCGLSSEADGSEDEPGGSLQIFAAASLTDTLTEIGASFEAEHSVGIDFNFAGSSDLAAQLQQGAPADVFVSADETNMDRVEAAGATSGPPRVFASNSLIIVTPPDNPADVHDLSDLAGEEVVTVLCAPQVPCGAAASAVSARAEVELTPASEENVVTDVLGKVLSGEADAGLVYRTDALAAGEDVEPVEIDRAEDVANDYSAAAVGGAADPELAAEFVDFLLSPEAQAVLSDAGFAAP